MFNLYGFLTFIIVTSYTPGPNNISCMSNASRYGLRKSIPFAAGVVAGFFTVISLSTLLSAFLFEFIPKVKPYMLVIGALYILWLAWKTLKSGSSNIELSDNDRPRFFAGFFLQFVNPKTIIYGITSMSSFILPYYSNPLTLFGFVLLLSFVGITSITCWSIFGLMFRKLFSKYSKVINIIMAILLVYCAVSLFL